MSAKEYTLPWSGMNPVPGHFTQVTGLFVGINDYLNHSDLANPENDAVELAETFRNLTNCRTKVLTGKQAILTNIDEALLEIGRNSDPGGLFIFHFSGHGQGIDFKTGMDGGQTGYMILQDAPVDLTSNAALKSVLDMTLLQRKVDHAGIKEKHQLYILDCCFSGLATREGFKSFRSALPQIDELDLDHQARFILSAGGPTQLVLDGGEVGHGLLTGALINILVSDSLSTLKIRQIKDRHYVRMLDVFSALSEEVRGVALQFFSGPTKGVNGVNLDPIAVRHPQGIDFFLKNVFLPDSDRKTRGQAQFLHERVQLPQHNSSQQIAQLLIPLYNGQKSRVTQSEEDTPPADDLYSDWAEATARKYQSPSFGNDLKRLFRLVTTGQPPAVEGHEQLAIQAEVYARPTVTWKDVGQVPLKDKLRAYYQLETLRASKPEWAWRRVRQSGDMVFPDDWLRVEVVNRGATPAYYYLVFLDEAGIVQWVAPENQSPGADYKDYTFGQPRLTPGQHLFLPGHKEYLIPNSGKHVFPDSWAVKGDLDLFMMLIVTRRQWSELEEVLHSVSRKGFALLKESDQLERVVDLPQAVFRSLGRRESSLESTMGIAGNSEGSIPSIITRTDSDLLAQTWKLDVVSKPLGD